MDLYLRNYIFGNITCKDPVKTLSFLPCKFAELGASNFILKWVPDDVVKTEVGRYIYQTP